MLQHVDAGLERLTQALDRRSVRLRDDAGLMAFFDDRLLLLGRELQEIFFAVAARAVLQEVDAARDVALDLAVDHVRRVPHEIRAGVLFPEAIDAADQRLRGGRFSRHVEIAAERSAEADDVAGDEGAGAGNVALVDAPADVDERLQRTPRVEDGRDAVLQRHLRSFFDEFFIASLVADDELDR